MIEYLPLVLTGLGLAASITYYAMILRNNNKSRQREMVYQKYQSHSLEYTRTFVEVSGMTDWDTTEEFQKKYGRIANPDAWAKILLIERSYNAV